MKTLFILLLSLALLTHRAEAQSRKQLLTFDQMFTIEQQEEFGLTQLSATQKEALRAHVEAMLMKVISARQSSPAKKAYRSTGDGHWIKKNIDRGNNIVLEDGSLWQISPIDRIDTALWLPISNITVQQYTEASGPYEYILINTSDRNKACAKYLGQE